MALDPLDVPTERDGPVTSRPQFVDPNLATGPVEFYGEPHPARGRPGESVYESTMQIGQLFAAGARGAPEPAEPSPPARGVLPAAVWAGIAAGLVVVLAAVLLIAGVL